MNGSFRWSIQIVSHFIITHGRFWIKRLICYLGFLLRFFKCLWNKTPSVVLNSSVFLCFKGAGTTELLEVNNSSVAMEASPCLWNSTQFLIKHDAKICARFRWCHFFLNGAFLSRCVQRRVSEWVCKCDGAHHVPDPQDDGSCADMATQTAAGGVPAVPGGEHRSVRLTAAPLALKDTLAIKWSPRPRPPSVESSSAQVKHSLRLRSVWPARYLSLSVYEQSGVGRWQVLSTSGFKLKRR